MRKYDFEDDFFVDWYDKRVWIHARTNKEKRDVIKTLVELGVPISKGMRRDYIDSPPHPNPDGVVVNGLAMVGFNHKDITIDCWHEDYIRSNGFDFVTCDEFFKITCNPKEMLNPDISLDDLL